MRARRFARVSPEAWPGGGVCCARFAGLTSPGLPAPGRRVRCGRGAAAAAEDLPRTGLQPGVTNSPFSLLVLPQAAAVAAAAPGSPSLRSVPVPPPPHPAWAEKGAREPEPRAGGEDGRGAGLPGPAFSARSGAGPGVRAPEPAALLYVAPAEAGAPGKPGQTLRGGGR